MEITKITAYMPTGQLDIIYNEYQIKRSNNISAFATKEIFTTLSFPNTPENLPIQTIVRNKYEFYFLCSDTSNYQNLATAEKLKIEFGSGETTIYCKGAELNIQRLENSGLLQISGTCIELSDKENNIFNYLVYPYCRELTTTGTYTYTDNQLYRITLKDSAADASPVTVYTKIVPQILPVPADVISENSLNNVKYLSKSNVFDVLWLRFYLTAVQSVAFIKKCESASYFVTNVQNGVEYYPGSTSPQYAIEQCKPTIVSVDGAFDLYQCDVNLKLVNNIIYGN